MDATEFDTQVHDAWSLLNLASYAMEDALGRVGDPEGEPDTDDATWRISNRDLAALYGAVEAVRTANSHLWGVLSKI